MVTQSEITKVARRRLPDERTSITHKFELDGQKAYVTIGLFEDGTPGELFVRIAKKGDTINGLMDSIGVLFSLALQHGVPLDTLTSKFKHTAFEPSGFTKGEHIHSASSIMDYLAKYLELKFGPAQQ